MKNKILAAVVAVAIAAVAIVNMDLVSSRKQEALSAIHLANIEALAQGETGGGKTCYNSITTKDGVKTLFCGSCSYVNNSTPSTLSGSNTCP